MTSIGSGQNIHLTKLSKGKKLLFLEGNDYKLLKKFADRCGYATLADDVTLTVVPIGGFTQKQRIEDVRWTFERVLRTEVSIAALLDRDYRCDEEVESLLSSVRQYVPHFYLLGSKELENYLLCPAAILSSVIERLKARGDQSNSSSKISIETIEEILRNCTEEIKSEVSAQVMAHRMRYFSKDSRDTATIIQDALKLFEAKWQNLEQRLKLVPGKIILSALNRKIQENYKISITPFQIISHINSNEIDQDLKKILNNINEFAEERK